MFGHLPLLVPLAPDHSDGRAVEAAALLAIKTDQPMRLLSATPPNGAEDTAMRMLEKYAAMFPHADITTQVVITDDVGAELAIASHGRTVVMTTAATLKPHDGHFGSMAEDLVRRSASPVVVVGPNAELTANHTPTRVVVPVDGSPLAETAIAPAISLAKIFDVPVWIVTMSSPADQAKAKGVLGAEFGAAESGYVRNLARKFGETTSVDIEFEVLHGHKPAESIDTFAEPDGMVVMTTHGRSGVSRLTDGSVATHVVALSNYPVLVVPPTGS